MIVIKPIVLLVVAGILVWWFFWPLVECSYALTWDPLFNPIHKFFLFIIGGMALVVAIIHGRKLLV